MEQLHRNPSLIKTMKPQEKPTVEHDEAFIIPFMLEHPTLYMYLNPEDRKKLSTRVEFIEELIHRNEEILYELNPDELPHDIPFTKRLLLKYPLYFNGIDSSLYTSLFKDIPFMTELLNDPQLITDSSFIKEVFMNESKSYQDSPLIVKLLQRNPNSFKQLNDRERSNPLYIRMIQHIPDLLQHAHISLELYLELSSQIDLDKINQTKMVSFIDGSITFSDKVYVIITTHGILLPPFTTPISVHRHISSDFGTCFFDTTEHRQQVRQQCLLIDYPHVQSFFQEDILTRHKGTVRPSEQGELNKYYKSKHYSTSKHKLKNEPMFDKLLDTQGETERCIFLIYQEEGITKRIELTSIKPVWNLSEIVHLIHFGQTTTTIVLFDYSCSKYEGDPSDFKKYGGRSRRRRTRRRKSNIIRPIME